MYSIIRTIYVCSERTLTMADRQGTLEGFQDNEPEDWTDVYSHGSPAEGCLIIIPEENLQEELNAETEDGYDSQVQAVLEAAKYGSKHLEADFKVYNPHESVIGCAQPGGDKPSACQKKFEELRQICREHSHQIRFESTELSRQEMATR